MDTVVASQQKINLKFDKTRVQVGVSHALITP